MNTLLIEARKKVDVRLGKEMNKLPKKIGLLSTVQYSHLLDKIKKHLEKAGKKVFLEKGKMTRYKGQILGCDVSAAEKVKDKIDAFLIIGYDAFHYSPVLMLEKPLFIFSPETGTLKKIEKKEIETMKIKKKSALMKFYKADVIGIIVSTKPGQYNLKKALELKKSLEKNRKKSFIFVCDNIELRERENFRCQAWINTACPSMLMEPEILNMQDIG